MSEAGKKWGGAAAHVGADSLRSNVLCSAMQPTGQYPVMGDTSGVFGEGDEAPNNVNASGQADILVSVTPDTADPSSVWLWAASDNLRVAASTAVESAEAMAAARPRGQIQ